MEAVWDHIYSNELNTLMPAGLLTSNRVLQYPFWILLRQKARFNKYFSKIRRIIMLDVKMGCYFIKIFNEIVRVSHIIVDFNNENSKLLGY